VPVCAVVVAVCQLLIKTIIIISLTFLVRVALNIREIRFNPFTADPVTLPHWSNPPYQHGALTFEQQQFWTAGSEGVKLLWLTDKDDSLVRFFSFQKPSVTGLHPTKGPVSGGTLLTLYGTDLDAGHNVQVLRLSLH